MRLKRRQGRIAALVAALICVALGARVGQAPAATGTVSEITYAGTLSETAVPYGRVGNSYSEKIKWELDARGSLHQLITGQASYRLTASGAITAGSPGKPPYVPAYTCSVNVTAPSGGDFNQFFTVSPTTGSVSVKLSGVLGLLSPKSTERQDLCWVDANYQWLLQGAEFPGPAFESAVYPATSTSPTGRAEKFDYTGSTAANSATFTVQSTISSCPTPADDPLPKRAEQRASRISFRDFGVNETDNQVKRFATKVKKRFPLATAPDRAERKRLMNEEMRKLDDELARRLKKAKRDLALAEAEDVAGAMCYDAKQKIRDVYKRALAGLEASYQRDRRFVANEVAAAINLMCGCHTTRDVARVQAPESGSAKSPLARQLHSAPAVRVR